MKVNYIAVPALLLSLSLAACGGGGSSSSDISGTDTTKIQCQGVALPLQVMALGDSITSGEVSRASYRYQFWQNLQAAGCLIDLVGSKRGVSDGRINGEQVLLNLDFDQDHEGYWQYRADQLIPLVNSILQSSSPDVILMHIGSNDLIQGESPANATSDIEKVVLAIQEHKPGTVIFLARLIPIANRVDLVRQVNSSLDQLVLTLNQPDSPVILVDMFTDFSVSRDLTDGIHPSETGERKIADRFSNALLAML